MSAVTAGVTTSARLVTVPSAATLAERTLRPNDRFSSSARAEWPL